MLKKILILYGSETGTAQDTAEQIWRDVKRIGIDCSVMSMDDYDVTKLIFEELAIFVVATAGQGDPPTNMLKFWRFLLRKNLPSNSLQNLQYGVLGLGDSSYEKYNFAAKKLNKRLAQLGGKEILSIGLADDQHDLGIDATTVPWMDELWTKLSSEFDIPLRVPMSNESNIIMKFNVTLVDGSVEFEDSNVQNDIYRHKLCINDTIKVGRVLENTRTSAIDHFQDVRLIEFQVEDVEYSPGDIIYLRPKNSAEKVDQFFEVLKNNKVSLYRDMIICVNSSEIRIPNVLQQRLTLGQIVEQYWDLNYKPRRYAMAVLSLITDNQLEREKLSEFTTPSGQEELYNYINRPRRNILEVLNDFPNATKKLNVQLLFEIMCPIKPRAFSIASSLKETPNQIDVLVAVVKYKTKLFEPRLGLCSNWLSGLKRGDETTFWVQKGTLHLEYSKPAILIGPGTGIAPFRSFLLERSRVKKDLSDCLLFFGCRNKLKDYHCRKDFEALIENYGLKMIHAFSRDQDNKIYVQHKIKEHGYICWQFIEKGASIYLAGTVPVRLSPGWEGTGRSEDELNFKGVTMDQADLEINPPTDRWNWVALVFVLHGIGSLMPWNMFITAKSYFADYKMAETYTGYKLNYASNFLSSLAFAAQVPNFLFNWLNLFIQLGDNLTARIVWGLLIQVTMFVLTVILAMADSSGWPGVFFWITMISVVILNTGSGIYQNSVYGMAAKLPAKYTGMVILGSNISGTFTAVIDLVAKVMSPNQRTAAIYYFITALLVLLACFDTYFALPLNRFYRYHELLTQKESNKKQFTTAARGRSSRPPYLKILLQCWPQCFNIFFTFFVTLAIFPSVQSDVKRSSPTFFVAEDYYVNIMCFMTFNVTAMIGSSVASLVQWPSKKYTVIPVVLRVLYIPLFLLCNYKPQDYVRTMPILIDNDIVFFLIALSMGFSSGYLSSIGMMYCPRDVEPQHQSTAGMYGAAFLITGIFTGVLFSMSMPYIVSSTLFS
ncbi:NADPH-dependent diflavin oxidoreductase 1 isoform X2 [Athalia rosae]|uniref:NADPH-dependent diflavin oxidoreductase 1 isoform X2 n=1 Tax=Athalia rosae TaxID=37344 RepID=UPI002033562A|nr:NADPH-dependent diflavin oxidoreductase 1 isoform X2 [Athalia rosae]